MKLALSLPLLALSLPALGLCPAPAHALDGELFLSWYDCAKDGAGLRDAVLACITNDGSNSLYCSFILGQPLDDVLGIEVTVDTQHAGTVLPDWWQLGAGQCRGDQLHVSGDFTQDFTCADFWRDLGAGEALYYPGLPYGHGGQARIVGTYAIRSDSARTLAAGTMYYGLKVVLGNARSVFPGQCDGCSNPTCLVLNNIKLLRSPGSVPSEVTLETPGPSGANRATWAGGSGADCSAVPVRSSSWGRLKSLYRP